MQAEHASSCMGRQAVRNAFRFSLLRHICANGFPLFGTVPRSGQPVDDCKALLRRLDGQPARRQNDRLIRRLRDALEHVQRRGSADTLDDHLKYLADLDAGRSHDSFALVRVIIWAIPILGFLGTVIGITLAIANLAPDALENSLPEVTKGLGVAFDTTALALALSIVLMLAQFVADRIESGLLAQVDVRTTAELEGRFEQIAPGPDGQLVAIRKMAETVVQVTEQLVHRQAELWQASMDVAAKRWTGMAEAAGNQMQKAMSAALAESLKGYAQQMGSVERSAAERNQHHLQIMQETQAKTGQGMVALQEKMVRQAGVLTKAIEATGKVATLEDTLNRNLASLAGAQNFEKTVMSLAAAIHLLNARLSETPAQVPGIQLEERNRNTSAA